ncbi:alpha/beta hydrolase [Microbacterium sp. YY-01]|uniref:alpha/beta hydrolase n=1 Tax=Microbacterium sp. YY-01 TaxID=3421634 RepID=UPI003D17AD62
MTDALVINSTATRWVHRNTDGPLLVLLHGYGADENDLLGLASYLPEQFSVAAVQAPLTPPFPTPGRSWYPIEGLDGRSAETVTAAATSFLHWLQATAPEREVSLLGFSQGAAVSLQALRLAPERFTSIVALSGYVTPGDLPHDEQLQQHPVPVFWGRGTHDDVIPAPLIDHTAQWLPSHSNLSGRVYTGLTHSISEEELADVHTFLLRWHTDAAPQANPKDS